MYLEARRQPLVKRELQVDGDEEEAAILNTVAPKRRRIHLAVKQESAINPFDSLCDDLVLSILLSLSSRAASPSDLISVSLTCNRFHELATDRKVLANASSRAVAVRPSAWCQDAHNFVQRCADCGNVEACFTLGMIKFYCLEKRREGLKLLWKASLLWHGDALFALAIIHFNGSGGRQRTKNERAGVALCVRAAIAGSVEATRELGHCLIEGQGLPRDTMGGRRLLLEANRKEAINFINARRTRDYVPKACGSMGGAAQCCRQRRLIMYKELLRRSLLADCGCAFPLPWLLQNAHPAHLFLAEWFQLHRPSDLLRVCSNALCGRPETRRLEFRQCSACSSAFYCSRSCQSMDWKLRHMLLCHPSLPSLV